MSPVGMFFMLLIAGLFLLGAEIFVPGGILGSIGGLALLGAIILGFSTFPGHGTAIAISIIFLVAIVVILWVKFFPQTQIGKSMTVNNDLKTSKASEEGLELLLGATGTTLSQLHPGGFAKINGKRVDVITNGEMIEKNKQVKVIEVEGNRIVVTEI